MAEENGRPGRHPRTWVIEPIRQEDEHGNIHLFADNEALGELVSKLLGTLDAVGGVLNIGTDRVKVGEIGGEPLGETVGYIVQWHGHSPLREFDDPGDGAAGEDDEELPEA